MLALAGCGGRERVAEPAAVLRVSQRNEPIDLDPAMAGLPDDFFIIRALGEGLVTPDPGGGPFHPAAALRWESSADRLTWTFHLRLGERWSNGEPVTAGDFVASFRRVLTPATAAPEAELFFDVGNARRYYAGQIADFSEVGIRAPDSRTLVVTLGEPQPHFLAYAASGPWIPVNPRVVSRYGPDWTRPRHFVGNGPYVLAEWLPNQRITVRKNPLYRNAASIRVEEIQFVRFDDGDSEERAFRAGEIDVTMAVPFSKLATYAREMPSELHEAPLSETRYLAFNTSRPPLDDPRVRRALSLAIDRERLVEDVLRGGQAPARRMLPPSLGALIGLGASLPDAAGPETARRLLAEAGFPGGRGFPRLELSGWSATPVLEVIQEMWSKGLGIETNVSVREARAHVAALRAGRYDVAFVTLIPDVADPLGALLNFSTRSPNNYPHWSDARYDALLDEAARTADLGRRGACLRMAERRLLEACPLAPLYFNTMNWLMRPGVRGWRQDAYWNRDYTGLDLIAPP
jgi:oligopeptide transport system substrate-binding protein